MCLPLVGHSGLARLVDCDCRLAGFSLRHSQGGNGSGLARDRAYRIVRRLEQSYK